MDTFQVHDHLTEKFRVTMMMIGDIRPTCQQLSITMLRMVKSICTSHSLFKCNYCEGSVQQLSTLPTGSANGTDIAVQHCSSGPSFCLPQFRQTIPADELSPVPLKRKHLCTL